MATSIRNRYAKAVHSKSLRSDVRKGDEGTTTNDTDVLGAFGFAARDLTDGWVTTGPDGQGYAIKPAPLAVPLERLLAGDHAAAHAIVRTLAEMAFTQSWVMSVRIGRDACHDLACRCLAWYRAGTCRVCGGHGYDLIPGVPSLSAHPCVACDGAGKVNIDRDVDPSGNRPGHRELARWLVAEIERESGRAGTAAMRKLAPTLDL